MFFHRLLRIAQAPHSIRATCSHTGATLGVSFLCFETVTSWQRCSGSQHAITPRKYGTRNNNFYKNLPPPSQHSCHSPHQVTTEQSITRICKTLELVGLRSSQSLTKVARTTHIWAPIQSALMTTWRFGRHAPSQGNTQETPRPSPRSLGTGLLWVLLGIWVQAVDANGGAPGVVSELTLCATHVQIT